MEYDHYLLIVVNQINQHFTHVCTGRSTRVAIVTDAYRQLIVTKCWAVSYSAYTAIPTSVRTHAATPWSPTHLLLPLQQTEEGRPPVENRQELTVFWTVSSQLKKEQDRCTQSGTH